MVDKKQEKKAPRGHDLVKEIAPILRALSMLIIAIHS